MMKKVLLIFFVLILSMPAAGRAQEVETRSSHGNDNVRPDSVLEELQSTILRHRSLRALPFRGGSLEYYDLLPGAVVQDYRGRDLLHIRGSRHDEIAYSFEGADVRSIYSGENIVRFIPEALDEISLTPSPRAGYAGAAGLVQHRLRRPSGDFEFNVRGETDRFTSDYQGRLGTFSYGYANFLGLAEGKIFKDNLRFLAAAERESFGDHYRKFWDGFRFGNSSGVPLRDPFTEQTLREIAGVDELVVKPGNIPNAAADRFTLNSILTGDFSALTVRAVGLYNWEKRQNNDTPIRELFTSLRIPETKNRSTLLSLQADLKSTKNFGAHLQFDLLRSENKTYDPVFEDNVELYRDSLAIVAKGLPWSDPLYGSYSQGPSNFYYFAFPFTRPGALLASYSRTEESGWEVSGALNKNLVKIFLNAGFAYQRRAVRHITIGNSLGYASVLRQASLTGQIADEYTLRRAGFVDVFGYDAFANRVESDTDTNDGPAQPSKFTAYVESRLRAKDIQVDIGLRYDRFASDARFVADFPIIPEFRLLELSELRTAPIYKYFLPRLTATFFATPGLTLKFDLGTYAQQPGLQDVYASRGHFSGLRAFSLFYLDPRAVTAAPVRVSQMDFVLAYQATPRFHLSAAVFRKYTEGQLQMKPVYASPEDTFPDSYVFGNDGESLAKGVELTLSYSHRGIFASANYTISRVDGFTSYPTTSFVNPYSEAPPGAGLMPMLPLEYNQTHRGNVLLGYEFDAASPALLRQMGVQTLLRFNSGHNYPYYHLGDAFG